jgi:DNA-binding NarL/FixJ family response regulator
VFLSELRALLPASRAGSGSRNANAGAGSKPPLTPRQLEILREVGLGHTDKQVARKLSLSPRTVEMHVANALLALKCRTRAEAVRRATELKLIS